MPQSPRGSISSTPNVETTRQWLIARIAAALKLDPHEVERDTQLAQHGISSLQALAITHDLGEFVGRKLSVTVMWEHPTIEALAPGKSITRRAALLDDVDRFDPLAFGISPREAHELDPAQRLALELSWEALEHARIPPLSLHGSATGVFFGSMWRDWADLSSGDLGGMSAHRATGQAPNMIANRVSYALGLRGPSLVVDTACSSALVGLHYAGHCVRSGEAELALVGGVNLLLAPETMVFVSKFGGLSPDGRCKAFSARADGFGRGEGGGVIVVKRLSHVQRDGDQIYALVRATAVNNDGASHGLTAPSPAAQEAVLREAYARAGIEPGRVQYVEAHGTGTPLGDPIELGALGAVLGRARPPERPLLVGSVKTNIAHTEAAAGSRGCSRSCWRCSTGRCRRACTASRRTRTSRGASWRSGCRHRSSHGRRGTASQRWPA